MDRNQLLIDKIGDVYDPVKLDTLINKLDYVTAPGRFRTFFCKQIMQCDNLIVEWAPALRAGLIWYDAVSGVTSDPSNVKGILGGGGATVGDISYKEESIAKALKGTNTQDPLENLYIQDALAMLLKKYGLTSLNYNSKNYACSTRCGINCQDPCQSKCSLDVKCS